MTGARFVKAGSFIDGSGAAVRKNVFLAIENGVIRTIGAAADLPYRDGVAVDDFARCTILPALVDCSVSLSRSPSVDPQMRSAAEEAGPAAKIAMLESHIRYCHDHGVLGVADSDSTGRVKRYREGLTQGSIIEIRTSGSLCRNRQDCAPGGPADGDFLRIFYSGDIEDDETPYPLLTSEDLQRILRQRGEKKAVVVANGSRQVGEALAAGCDAIEQGYAMGEANLRVMAEKNVLWIPSVLRSQNAFFSAGSGGAVSCRFSMRYVAPGKTDPGTEGFWRKTLADQLAQVRLAKELGVKTAVGTGAGSVGIIHGESMIEEMKLLIKAGYSLEEAIRSASTNGAFFFGMKNPGPLAVGRRATFLIARGAVQQLPRKLSYLEGIYVDGEPSSTYRRNPRV